MAVPVQLKRGEALGELGDDARLGDARDADRLAGSPLEHEARAPVQPVRARATDTDTGEALVRPLLRLPRRCLPESRARAPAARAPVASALAPSSGGAARRARPVPQGRVKARRRAATPARRSPPT